MRFVFTLLIITFLGFTAFTSSATAGDGIARTDVFVGGEDSYNCYRIPSLLMTKKGTLLAFCEGRVNDRHDNGDIDLLLKRSFDGGKTWSKQQVIWNDSTNTCGNPTAVLDQKSGTIWLFMTHNPGSVDNKILKQPGSVLTRTVWLTKSDDDGKTWSVPVNLTSDLKPASWGWYATGPGVGIQLQRGPHKGRLVIPACHNRAQNKKTASGSHIIYSDDSGKTWQLGGTVHGRVSEAQVVELSDGALLMNMRTISGEFRSQSISRDGGITWTEAVLNRDLLEPICQGTIVRHSWPSRKGPGRLLFANPTHENRRLNMTVHSSLDDGQTWTPLKTIYPEWSAYSCLAVLRNGDIASFYENGDIHANERISFARFPMK